MTLVKTVETPPGKDVPVDHPDKLVSYLGVSHVWATPMTKGEFKASFGDTEEEPDDDAEGYFVSHPDYPNNTNLGIGHINWRDKDSFERIYHHGVAGGMCFGAALDCLKRGDRVTRKGWNGKGMYLWLKPAVTVKREWCRDPMLINAIDENGGAEIEAFGTICMKTADNKVLTGWLASQTDMLSEDWLCLPPA